MNPLHRWDLLRPRSPEVGADLLHRWSEPHRAYHDLRHLDLMLDAVDLLRDEADDADAVRLAVWFHDAVYDPLANDNEERSARLAEQAIGDPEVARLVRLTVGHDPAPDDRNGRVLCDADLSILGAAPADYASYAVDVRTEYAHVPDADFRAGRGQILRGFLARDQIYHCARAVELWEARARTNIEQELRDAREE